VICIFQRPLNFFCIDIQPQSNRSKKLGVDFVITTAFRRIDLTRWSTFYSMNENENIETRVRLSLSHPGEGWALHSRYDELFLIARQSGKQCAEILLFTGSVLSLVYSAILYCVLHAMRKFILRNKLPRTDSTKKYVFVPLPLPSFPFLSFD